MAARPINPLRKIAIELCKKFPDANKRTLATRLQKESNGTKTIEQCRSMIRDLTGCIGKQRRNKAPAELVRSKGVAGTVPQMPPSLAEPFTPHEISGPCRVAILSDLHVPYHDEKALSAAVEYCKKAKPDVVVLNGDFGDFHSISRFDTNPKHRNLTKELEIQRDVLGWLRAEFPKQRFVFHCGNHEERWDHYLWNHAPEISDFPQMRLSDVLHFSKYNIEYVGDRRPIMLGKLPVIHGHELTKGLATPVNPARGLFLRTTHTALMGHSHRTSGHAESDMFRKEVFCWSTGALCDLTPYYARFGKTNHGFAFVTVFKDGSFDVENYRITNGIIRRG